MNGYVHFADFNADELKMLLTHLFQANDDLIVRRVDAIEFLAFALDQAGALIADWEEGQIFSDKAELRWKRKNDGWTCLLLSEQSKELLLAGYNELIAKWQAVAGKPFAVVPHFNQSDRGFLLWGTRPDADQWWETRIPRPLHYPRPSKGRNSSTPQLTYQLYSDGEDKETVRWVRLLKLTEVKQDAIN